ncbi:MAG: hypothetical protein WBB43_27025 [Limnoraphis sp.]
MTKTLSSHCRSQGILVNCKVQILDVESPKLSIWHGLELAKKGAKDIEGWIPIDVNLKGQTIHGLVKIVFKDGLNENQILRDGDVMIESKFSTFLDPFTRSRVNNIFWKQIVDISKSGL